MDHDNSIKCLEGPDGFEALVRTHQGWVRGYLRSRLRDWAGADDLAQDVFVTAFLRRRNFRGESTIEVWLRGIARNHLRNYLRKHRAEAVGGSEELQELLEQNCDQWENTNDKLLALRECLQQLPDPSRRLLDERYVQGRSVREIAHKTSEGYSALTMQFYRLREGLATCIKKKMLRDAI